tara:strand:- start:141 stop:977 length:837 start_codon:yes stop_codon:yes gene_type:complete
MKAIWGPGHIEYLRKHYSEQGSDCSIALPFSSRQVVTKASKLGLRVSTRRKSQTQSTRSQNTIHKTNIDVNKFCNPQSPNTAYALGFMWADGYINDISQSYRIEVEIKRVDADDVFPHFNHCGDWTRHDRNRPNREPQARICTGNKRLFQFLKSFDYHLKRKEAPEKIVQWVCPSVAHVFWRGYFDGDGWFHLRNKKLYQAGFAGTYHQNWSSTIHMLKSIGCTFGTRRQNYSTGQSSAIIISNKPSVKNLGKYIYSEPLFGLKRKYDQWSSIFRDDQ